MVYILYVIKDNLLLNRKEGNILFNDPLNTFYLRLYGVRHMVNTTQIAREETRSRQMGYSFRLAALGSFICTTQRQDRTYHGVCYTSHGTLTGTRNSSMDPPRRIDPCLVRSLNSVQFQTVMAPSVVSCFHQSSPSKRIPVSRRGSLCNYSCKIDARFHFPR